MQKNQLVKFLRQKDYKYIKDMGRGGCGKTILLHDEIIDENFVCKKYDPYFPEHKEELFRNFIQEIKLLHLINHENIVRVFNYYIYPDQLTGYIMMEHVDGLNIESHMEWFPETINELFVQAIEGFSYLQLKGILHRDIRPPNIMISDNNVLKIIDFGFGKPVSKESDFDKSVTLNWWCDPPPEFSDGTYDFQTEVYFVGKLFEKLISDFKLGEFKYTSVLNTMCTVERNSRAESFIDIRTEMLSNQLPEIDFTQSDRETYRRFAHAVEYSFSSIRTDSTYQSDIEKVQVMLSELYRRVMLEEYLPDVTKLLNCFIKGGYHSKAKSEFQVELMKEFMELLRRCSREKNNIILSNLHTRIDAVRRIDHPVKGDFDEDIPF